MTTQGHASAAEWGRRAVVLAESLQEHAIQAHALNTMGTASWNAGDPGTARSCCLRACGSRWTTTWRRPPRAATRTSPTVRRHELRARQGIGVPGRGHPVRLRPRLALLPAVPAGDPRGVALRPRGVGRRGRGLASVLHNFDVARISKVCSSSSSARSAAAAATRRRGTCSTACSTTRPPPASCSSSPRSSPRARRRGGSKTAASRSPARSATGSTRPFASRMRGRLGCWRCGCGARGPSRPPPTWPPHPSPPRFAASAPRRPRASARWDSRTRRPWRSPTAPTRPTCAPRSRSSTGWAPGPWWRAPRGACASSASPTSPAERGPRPGTTRRGSPPASSTCWHCSTRVAQLRDRPAAQPQREDRGTPRVGHPRQARVDSRGEAVRKASTLFPVAVGAELGTVPTQHGERLPMYSSTVPG